MGRIPGAGDARDAPRAVIRVLLRCALLAGLVIGGWLLGSATALAQESWSPQDHAPQDHVQQEQAPIHREQTWQDRVSPDPDTTRPDAAPAKLITEVASAEAHGDDLLAAVQAVRSPVRQPVSAPAPAVEPEQQLPDSAPALHPVPGNPVLEQPVLNLAQRVLNVVRLVPAAVEPVLSQVPVPHSVVLTGQVPVPTQFSVLVPTAATELTEPAPSADLTGMPGGAIATPSVLVTRTKTVGTAAPRLSHIVAPLASDGPVSPLPQGPPISAPTCSLVASAGSSTTTKSPHTVTLNDGSCETNRAVLHHRMRLQADGVPGVPSRRPSTSPD